MIITETIKYARLPMAALVLLAMFCTPANALYKCEYGGVVVLEDMPCANVSTAYSSRGYGSSDETSKSNDARSDVRVPSDLRGGRNGEIGNDLDLQSHDGVADITADSHQSIEGDRKEAREVRYDAENDRLSFEMNGVMKRLCGISQSQYNELRHSRERVSDLDFLLLTGAHVCD